MKHKFLKSAEKILKNYYLEYTSENTVALSMNKHTDPFAFLIVEPEEYPNTILISLAADFTDTFMVAKLVLSLINISKLELSEQFYVDKEGSVLFGENAYYAMLEDEDDSLINMAPISKSIN